MVVVVLVLVVWEGMEKGTAEGGADRRRRRCRRGGPQW